MNLIRAVVYGGLAALLGALIATTAFAQGYPAPIGHIFLTAECPAEMGGVAFVTATVRDENGSPVIGIPVTFTIGAQPGDDAFVFTAARANGTAATLATDAGGTAHAQVNVGSSPGTVVIRAVAGQRAAQVICVVAAKQEAFDVVLPATGTGPGSDTSSGNGIQTITMVGLSLLTILGLGLMVASARSRARRG